MGVLTNPICVHTRISIQYIKILYTNSLFIIYFKCLFLAQYSAFHCNINSSVFSSSQNTIAFRYPNTSCCSPFYSTTIHLSTQIWILTLNIALAHSNIQFQTILNYENNFEKATPSNDNNKIFYKCKMSHLVLVLCVLLELWGALFQTTAGFCFVSLAGLSHFSQRRWISSAI